MRPLIEKLDEVNMLLADVERTRASAVRFALEGKAEHANAQVCLMNDYIDTLVLRAIEAAELAGPSKGVPSCLS